MKPDDNTLNELKSKLNDCKVFWFRDIGKNCLQVIYQMTVIAEVAIVFRDYYRICVTAFEPGYRAWSYYYDETDLAAQKIMNVFEKFT